MKGVETDAIPTPYPQASTVEEAEWHVIYVMPNLAPAPTSWEKDPADPNTHANLFWTGVSLDCETVAIVSMHDARVQRAIRSDPNAARLLDSFVDTNRKKLHPSVLVIRADSAFTREQEGIIAFRNCVALSVVLHARAGWAKGGNLGGGWSDYFDFHPLQVGARGLISVSAAQLAIFTERADYQAMPSPYVSATTTNALYPDRFLRTALGMEWRRYYERPTERTKFGRALFRSLEIAYLASASPVKHGGSMYEMGVNIALWVSAIEVLVSALYKKTDQWHSLDLLEEYEWGHYQPKLREQTRTLEFGKGDKNTLRQINVVQHACHLVYNARHKFLHGAKVKERELWPWGAEDRADGEPAPSVATVAPLVYRIALHAFLSRKYQTKRDDSTDAGKYILPDGILFSEYDYSSALRAIYRLDDDDLSGADEEEPEQEPDNDASN